MEFKIDPQAMENVFVVPWQIVDKHIILASGTQLRVLLYIYRHGMTGKTFTCKQIAEALTRVEVEEVEDAVIYWREHGVLMQAGDERKKVSSEKAIEPTVSESAAEKENTEEAKKIERLKKEDINGLPKIPITKPSHEQVAARVQECEQFKLLFDEAQKKLGRTVGYDGQSTLIMLHDSYGLPMEVILMLLEYATAKGQNGYSSISNIGKIWAEKEIFTIESAEEYIKQQTGVDLLWKELCRLIGKKEMNPTTKQRRFLTAWSAEYGYGIDIIYMASEIAIDNTEKFSPEYIDKILKGWHDNGVKTPEEAEKLRKNFTEKKKSKKKSETKNKSGGDSSYDLDEFAKRSVGLKYKAN